MRLTSQLSVFKQAQARRNVAKKTGHINERVFRRSFAAVATSREGQRLLRSGPAQGLPSIRLLLAQYPFNSLHNWHFEILFIVAIIIQLIHIVLEAL